VKNTILKVLKLKHWAGGLTTTHILNSYPIINQTFRPPHPRLVITRIFLCSPLNPPEGDLKKTSANCFFKNHYYLSTLSFKSPSGGFRGPKGYVGETFLEASVNAGSCQPEGYIICFNLSMAIFAAPSEGIID
jgi:hypothetical protein